MSHEADVAAVTGRLRELLHAFQETQALLQQYQQEIHEVQGRLKELAELQQTARGDGNGPPERQG